MTSQLAPPTTSYMRTTQNYTSMPLCIDRKTTPNSSFLTVCPFSRPLTQFLRLASPPALQHPPTVRIDPLPSATRIFACGFSSRPSHKPPSPTTQPVCCLTQLILLCTQNILRIVYESHSHKYAVSFQVRKRNPRSASSRRLACMSRAWSQAGPA